MRHACKLIVMIPCYNEEKSLPDVLKTIPKRIPGISKIETLVVDDGSTDETLHVAKKYRVKHFVIHRHNQGLAKSFADGLDEALALGADIIVNTDGDNQYPQEDIPRLIRPIMTNEADMVVADRQTDKIAHFSPVKKFLQKFGSYVVRIFSGVNVPDAVSGFRARKTKRNSRLIKSVWSYVKASAATTLRLFALYEPLKVFGYIALTVSLPGFILFFRFFYFFILGTSGGHIQSLIVGAVFILTGFQIGLIGLLADLISINRKKSENILYRIKKIELEKNNA